MKNSFEKDDNAPKLTMLLDHGHHNNSSNFNIHGYIKSFFNFFFRSITYILYQTRAITPTKMVILVKN